MTWFSRKKSLSQKLIDIVAEMPRLTKNGHRADFSYLQISDLANAFYGCAKKAGVIVVPNDLECRSVDGGMLVKTKFTIHDDGDRIFSLDSYGFAREDGKWGALPIAQTMALKALLKRLGMTFGEEDDAEYSGESRSREWKPLMADPLDMASTTNPVPPGGMIPFDRNSVSLEELGRPDLAAKLKEQENVPEPPPNPSLVISENDARQFNRECRAHQKDLAMRRDWLKVTFGTWDIRELKSQAEFEKALAWARGKEDLSETLAKSVEAVKQGPQPVTGIMDRETEPFAGQF